MKAHVINARITWVIKGVQLQKVEIWIPVIGHPRDPAPIKEDQSRSRIWL